MMNAIQKAPKLTKKQRQVFELIVDWIETHNKAPTYREIQLALQFKSRSSVNKIMVHLKEKGYVSVKRGWCGGIEVLG